MLRWCGRELTKLNPSSCCQGMEAYSSETLGFSMPDMLLEPLPSFPEPSLASFITGLGRRKASRNSSLHHVGGWGFRTEILGVGGGAVALRGGKKSL